ncbi:MAG: ABC transporter permease subunit [Candidatus Micrarchaeia archaeon]
MFIAYFISLALGISIGIYSATSKTAEKILIPIIDIMQTLPILAFFPFAIMLVVYLLPGDIGINAAIIFLIITSMLWNIIFGAYESVKKIPNEIWELSRLFMLNKLQKIKKILMPAVMPTVVDQSMLSWAIGLFYLVTSEIFSTGTKNYSAKFGIGVELTKLAFSTFKGHLIAYLIGIAIFIAFVILTVLLFFMPLEDYINAYNKEPGKTKKILWIEALRYIYMVAYEFANKLALTINSIKPKSKNYSWHSKISNKICKIFIYKKSAYTKKTKRSKSLYAIILSCFVLCTILSICGNYINYMEILNDEYIVLINIAASFIRIWGAFILILIAAIPISIYVVFISKDQKRYVVPFLVFASIPATIFLPALISLFVNWSESGNIVAIMVFFFSGIWYIIFSVIASTKTIDKNILEVKKEYGVRGWKAFKYIYIKAIAPGLVTGAVTGIAAEWNASIVAEYFTQSGISGSNIVTEVGYGIGKLLDISLSTGNNFVLLLSLFNLTAMIIIINTFVWKRVYKKETEHMV